MLLAIEIDQEKLDKKAQGKQVFIETTFMKITVSLPNEEKVISYPIYKHDNVLYTTIEFISDDKGKEDVYDQSLDVFFDNVVLQKLEERVEEFKSFVKVDISNCSFESFAIKSEHIKPEFFKALEETIHFEKNSILKTAARKEVEQTKKYRLGYDFLFLPKGSFTYKGDLIGAMAVYVLFKIFNAEGKEVPFEANELKDQKIYYSEGFCYPSDLLICSFDREDILKFELNVPLIEKFKGSLQVQWEIDDYTKDIDKGILEPETITEEEFFDIMKNNIDTFDNSDNRSAQSTSYFTKEIIDLDCHTTLLTIP
jgi:hypothetical protein